MKNISNIPGLSKSEVLAINIFSSECKDILRTNLIDIKLYGSKTKGTSDFESDIDILIITKMISKEQKDLIFSVVTDINLDYDVLIIPIITESNVYNSPLSQETYFYKTTQEEGISL